VKAPLLLLSLLAALSAASPGAAQDSLLVLVTHDSVPLRTLPSSTAPIAKYGRATLQLAVVGASTDSAWYRVGIGEDKGYQLRHGDRYWVARTDVIESRPFEGAVSVDLSLLEVPSGAFSTRVTAQEYIARNGNLAGSYYVSPVYTARTSTPTCSSPFSVCAQIYRPGSYFIGPAGHPESERSVREQLYSKGAVRARYEVRARRPLRAIRERLIVARVLMRHAGCYAEDYVGTELKVLRDTTRTIVTDRAAAHLEVGPDVLFEPGATGEVQFVNLMWLLEFSHINGERETIARRITLWWPLCA